MPKVIRGKKINKVPVIPVDATRQSKIETLQSGKNSEFWRIIVEIMIESKEDIDRKMQSEEMQDLSPEIYKLTNELFKAKKALIDKLIETPDNVIAHLSVPDAQTKEFDPYAKETDL